MFSEREPFSFPRRAAMSELIYSDHEAVDWAFHERVAQIADRLGIEADWLMACMAFETGLTFSPSVKNPRSSATGLIQFMSFTAKKLGTSTRALSKMTALEQLDYVEKYFRPWKGRLRSIEDVYMAILWPKAIGRSPDYPLWDRDTSRAYRVNAGLDIDKDGRVTKREAASKVIALYQRGKRERSARQRRRGGTT